MYVPALPLHICILQIHKLFSYFFPAQLCCDISNFKTSVFLILTKINAVFEEKADEEKIGDVVSMSWEVRVMKAMNI